MDYKKLPDRELAFAAIHDDDAEREWVRRLEKEDETFPLTGVDNRRNIGNEWYGLSWLEASRQARADADNDEEEYDNEG